MVYIIDNKLTYENLVSIQLPNGDDVMFRTLEEAQEFLTKELQPLTRKQLAEHLYYFYRQEGTTPIGRKTPLTLKEFTHRYLNGCGAAKGFKKDELISLYTRRAVVQ